MFDVEHKQHNECLCSKTSNSANVNVLNVLELRTHNSVHVNVLKC
jgi:hypothetical protein